jgi:hypothetical protein
MAMVVSTIHKRHVLPLVQQALFLYQMTPEASLFGTQMLEEPMSASEISHQILRTVVLELAKDYRFISMHPEEGYISMVSTPFCFLICF